MPKINIHKAWRPSPATLIHAGIYRVPRDMSVDMAQKAVACGAGTMQSEEPAKTNPDQTARGRGRKPATKLAAELTPVSPGFLAADAGAED
jgi:hypothetical protein